jgi:CubicO group peptidase (beta-lactamase class C family)
MKQLVALACVAMACRDAPRGHPEAEAQTEVEPPTTLDAAAIEAWVASQLEKRGVVGAALGVVRDGKTIVARGFGRRRLGSDTPVDADTPFAIGSVSKQLTCAAVLSLVDDGKLAMTDTVAKYYPKLTRAADITLDDLGANISGYRDYYPMDYTDARMRVPIEPDALLAQYAGMPLDFEPRTRTSYSNTNFVLLGRIAERVSGMPLPKLLETKVLAPLGMTRTRSSPGTDAATGHFAFQLEDVEIEPAEASGWLLGAADVYSTVNDLVRWDLALADGKILSEAGRAALAKTHRLRDGRIVSYGCGLGTSVRRNEQLLGHTGAVAGFFAYNTVVPRTRSAVILLSNDARIDVSDIQDRLVNLVVDTPAEVPTIRGPAPEVAARQMFEQLQRGKVDRELLGEDLAGYFNDVNVAKAAPRLRALGEPTKIRPGRRSERGGWEVTRFDFVFPERTLEATMFRSPDGKIRQFQLSK